MGCGEVSGAFSRGAFCEMSSKASCKTSSSGSLLLLGDKVFLRLVALRAAGVVSVGDNPVRRLFLNRDPIVPSSPLLRLS